MSSLVAELYGHRLRQKGQLSGRSLDAICPFSTLQCDGGGNRDMARIPSSDEQLAPLFTYSVSEHTKGYFPCGVCSVEQAAKGAIWAICPRRLLTFGKSVFSTRHRDLAVRILKLAGFQSGQPVDVWSEISLSERSKEGKTFKYRLDYVLRGHLDDSPPVIVEVMTCSTSGGNKQKGTNISAAFRRAVLYAHGNVDEQPRAPGVNVRQVWARMASQMIAKSQAALSWGGSTIWVVQDELAHYIDHQTALPLAQLRALDWTPGEVNMVVSDLGEKHELYSGPVRPTHASTPCWMDILGAAHIPKLESVEKKLEQKPPIANLVVP